MRVVNGRERLVVCLSEYMTVSFVSLRINESPFIFGLKCCLPVAGRSNHEILHDSSFLEYIGVFCVK